MMHAENGPAIDIVAAAARRRGQDRPLLPRRRPLPDLRGRGDEPRDPPGRGRGRARLHRPPLGHRRPRTPSARPATGAPRRSPRPARSTCSSSLDDLGNGFEGSKFVCSPPLREKNPNWEELWTGLRKNDLQVVSTDHCPFDFHGQKELGRGDFRKIPNGLPGVEDRVDLLHDGGVVAGRISKERWVEIISTEPAQAVRDVPAQGRDRGRRRRGPRRLRPEPEAHDQRRDAPHGRRLLVLRGPPGPGRVRRRAQPRVGRRPRRRVHRAARATAGSSSAAPPTTPGSPRAAGRHVRHASSTATSSRAPRTRSSTPPARTTRRSSREPGNLRFDVIQSRRRPDPVPPLRVVRDEAAAARPQGQPHYFAWREATADHFVEPRQGVRYVGLFPADAARVTEPAGDPRVRARPAAADHVRRGDVRARPGAGRRARSARPPRHRRPVAGRLGTAGGAARRASARRALDARRARSRSSTSRRRRSSIGRSRPHRAAGVEVVRRRGWRQRAGCGEGDRRAAADRDERPRPPRGRRARAPLPRAVRPVRRRPHDRRHGQRGEPQRRDQRARPRRLQALVPRRAARRGGRGRRPGPARRCGAPSDRRERHGRGHPAPRELRLVAGRAR